MVDRSGRSELELLHSLKQDDENAFTEIYNKYYQTLFKTAYNIIRDKNISQDVIQEVFLSLWNRRHTAVITSVEQYLKQAARFQVYNAIRDRKVDAAFYKRLGEVVVDIIEHDPVLFKEQVYIINALVESMPEEHRKPFLLHRFENKTYEEIAGILGISKKRVEYRIRAALDHIRDGMVIILFLVSYRQGNN